MFAGSATQRILLFLGMATTVFACGPSKHIIAPLRREAEPPPDLRLLAAPLVVLGDDIREVESSNAFGRHFEIWSIRINRVVSDPIGNSYGKRIALIATLPTEVDSSENVRAILFEPGMHAVDELPFVLLYLMYDRNIRAYVPINSSWAITPLASPEEASRELPSGTVDQAFNRIAVPTARDRAEYLSALRYCPETVARTLSSVLPEEQNVHERVSFLNWRLTCFGPFPLRQ